MQKKLTITVDEAVYQGLYDKIGKRNISRFLSDLARPHVVSESFDEGYRAMGADSEREYEAKIWSEGLIDSSYSREIE
jgi:hypothetical protein